MNFPRKKGSFNSSNQGRALKLNCAPILFDDTEVEVGIAPYGNKEQLRILRQTHSDTHFFYRDGQQTISVATVPNVLPIGEHLNHV